MNPSSPPARGKAHLDKVLFTAEQIRTRVDELAGRIAADTPRSDLIAIAILKGSFVFLADLARRLSGRGIHLIVDFMALSSYGARTASSGSVTLQLSPTLALGGRSLLLLDDILDSGLTLQTARDLLFQQHGAAEVRTCVLLDKPSRRAHPFSADYVGFEIPDVFAVGYGLDYDNQYRHLPYLAALRFDAPGGDPP
jgi:hypoxanthine phosphoribosyltransferase